MVRERRGKRDGLRYLTRERLACWGRRGKERDGVRDEMEREKKKGHIFERESREMYLRLRCTGAHSCGAPPRPACGRLVQHTNMYPVFLKKRQGLNPEAISMQSHEAIAARVELAGSGGGFLGTETANNSRLGNNLTTALLSQSSLVRLEF